MEGDDLRKHPIVRVRKIIFEHQHQWCEKRVEHLSDQDQSVLRLRFGIDPMILKENSAGVSTVHQTRRPEYLLFISFSTKYCKYWVSNLDFSLNLSIPTSSKICSWTKGYLSRLKWVWIVRPTSRLAANAAVWWIDGLLTRKPLAPIPRSISSKRKSISGLFVRNSYLVSFEIEFYPDFPTNHRVVDILCQNVSNEQIYHQYSLHLHLNIYKYKTPQNPHSNHVNVMEYFQQHALNPNQQHNPNWIRIQSDLDGNDHQLHIPELLQWLSSYRIIVLCRIVLHWEEPMQ